MDSPHGNKNKRMQRKSRIITNLVIAPGNSEDVAGHGPAHMPHYVLEGVQGPKERG